MWSEHYSDRLPEPDTRAGAMLWYATPAVVEGDKFLPWVLPGRAQEILPYHKGRIQVGDDLPPGFSFGSAVRLTHRRLKDYLLQSATPSTLQAFALASYDFGADVPGDILATHRAYITDTSDYVLEVVQSRPIRGKVIPTSLDILRSECFHVSVKTAWNTPPSHSVYREPGSKVYLLPRPQGSYLRWWVDHRADKPTVEAYLGDTRLVWETHTETPEHLRIHGDTSTTARKWWNVVNSFYQTHATFLLG